MRQIVKTILNAIPSLSHTERVLLNGQLSALGNMEKICDLIEAPQEENPCCPHCDASQIHKHGLRNNLQRYKCKCCHRTFNALTKTPFAHLRKKEYWLSYFNCMIDSATVRETAGKIGINNKTSFRWRHRFSTWMYKDSPKSLDGIIEADETYYQYSEKGTRQVFRKPHQRGSDGVSRGLSKDQVPVFTACDRSHHLVAKKAGRGTINSHWIENFLPKFLAKDAVLVTDGLQSYKSLCRKNKITHVIIQNKPGKRSIGSYHIQHINSFHSRLRFWIDGHFHGVATKYLNNYLSWKHELEKVIKPTNIEMFLASYGQIHP